MSLAAATSTTTAAGTAATGALGSIASNYNEFLTLLTTQLQNQDPDNPTDTSQFTSELAQFAGVEQQVNTNTNLTTLIQLTQGQSLLQGAALVGKQAELSGTTLPLQNGQANLTYTAPLAQPVQITVTDANGNTVVNTTVQATAGSNSWAWNGQNSGGGTEADGAYTVSVQGVANNGTTSPLAFNPFGTVTGVANTNGSVNVALGAASVPLSSVVDIES